MKHKRKHLGESSEEPPKKKQAACVQEIIGSEESVACASEQVSSTEMKSTKNSVDRKKRHKQKCLDDISVRKHSGESSEEPTKEKQVAYVQKANGSQESVAFASEPVSSTEMKSMETSFYRKKRHRQKNSEEISNKTKHKKHKANIGDSRQIVDSQEMTKSPDVEFVCSNALSSSDTDGPEKSVNMTKTPKQMNSNGTTNKHKRKKQETPEKESSESLKSDLSGYNYLEPDTETSSVDLAEILELSAQKFISEADSKKSVDYKTATKSYPMLSKCDDGQSSRRLAEFKSRNSVSWGIWKRICKDLERKGKKYNTGRFSQDENEQLRKNWKKLIKSCPFQPPHALLMKNHFPDLQNDIENFMKEKNFYVKLGKRINRPPYNVYIRARKMFHPGNGKGRYTAEEVEMLKRHYHEHGSHWQKIGQLMDRSGQSLNDRFKKLKTTAAFGPWSLEEDDQLKQAIKNVVADHTGDDDAYFNFPWTEIARNVPTRNSKQCRDHWVNLLAFGKEGKNKFRKEEKICLIYEIMATDVSHESEINWIELKSKFNVPSPQFLQHRWHLLKLEVPDFERCSLREVLEYLERKFVQPVDAILEKKQKDDTTVVGSEAISERSPKSTRQNKEVNGDEEEQRLCSFSEASPAWWKFFPHMTGAVDWLHANRHLFRQTVLEPRVMSMSECEIEELVALDAASIIPSYHVAEATSFLFKDSDDIDLFIQKVRVDLNLRINCAML